MPFSILLVLVDNDRLEGLHGALEGFAGIGSAFVATLIATGLPHLWSTEYGQLLTIKLVLFLGMLGLATANRFRLAPRLGRALVKREEPGAAVHTRNKIRALP